MQDLFQNQDLFFQDKDHESHADRQEGEHRYVNKVTNIKSKRRSIEPRSNGHVVLLDVFVKLTR